MVRISVLIIEDSYYSADLNLREIKKAGFEVYCHQLVCSAKAMEEALKERDWNLIISDNFMPNFNALEALTIRNRRSRKTPFIIVSEDILPRDIKTAFAEGCSAFVSKEALTGLRKVVGEIFTNNSGNDEGK